MRCPQCNKFVSYDDSPEPEIEDYEPTVEETLSGGEFIVPIRVVLPCADCGEELAECSMEAAMGFDHECDKEAPEDAGSYDRYDVKEVNADFTSRQQTTFIDRRSGKTKPIKNYRYMPTYYGAEVSATVRCNRCGEEIDVSGTVEEQASAFESMV